MSDICVPTFNESVKGTVEEQTKVKVLTNVLHYQSIIVDCSHSPCRGLFNTPQVSILSLPSYSR